jgi:hypothetical protein
MAYRRSHLKLCRKLCQLLGWVFLFLLGRRWVRLRPGNIPGHITLGTLPILYTWYLFMRAFACYPMLNIVDDRELATASQLPAPWGVMPLNRSVILDIGVFMTQ